MASTLVTWRRLLALRTRLAEGEQMLLKACEARLAEVEQIYQSHAFGPGHPSVRADSIAAAQSMRDDSWREMQLRRQEVAERRTIWQRAKREQRQAEMLLEQHARALRTKQDRREQSQQEDWLRAQFAGAQEGK